VGQGRLRRSVGPLARSRPRNRRLQRRALLAFHLDVELRLRGEPGLLQLFRDLAAENGRRWDLATLEKWCDANGLEASWQRHVAGPTRTSADDDLVRAGWRERREGDARIITAAGADLAGFFALER
jgi:hypothetical protein